MKFRTVLLSGASLLAMTAHACADPVSIGSAIISAFLSVGAGALLPVASASAIGLGAIGLAVTAANLAFQFMGRRPTINPNDIKQTTAGAEGPGRYATGRVKLGAKIGFGNTSGYDIFRLLLHCFGPITAFEEFFYDGREITVESDGAVSSPPWTKPGGSYLHVQTKPGTGSETAWPDLISAFPSLWTADHRVRGIGQALLHAINPGTGNEKFPRLFQGGVKELEAVARVGLFHDPRTGASAWSHSGVLQCLHWFRRLPGITDDLIDFDAIEPVATQAEVLVPTLTGTAPRCTVSGGWEGALTYDIVLDMLESAGLDLREGASDLYRLEFIEDDPASEITFLDRHILDRDYVTGEEAAKRPNKCVLRYFSPERGYELAEIDLTNAPWARVQEEIDRYGEHEYPIDLVFCDDASQAQRIARRLFWMARAETGILRTTLAGRAAFGKRTITFEIPDVGEGGASIFVKARKGTARLNAKQGYCDIPFQVIPDILKAPWNPASDEVPAPPVLPLLQYESALATPAAPSEATVVQYLSGAYETRLKFTTVTGATQTEAVYRTYTGGEPDPFENVTTVYAGVDPVRYGYFAENTDGLEMDFKVRLFDADDEGSYFSGVLNVDPMAFDNTAPAAPGLIVGIDNATIMVTATVSADEMRATNIKVEMRREITAGAEDYGPWELAGEPAVRPSQNGVVDKGYAFVIPVLQDGADIQVRASTRVSNGTYGPYAAGTVTYDEPPP